MSLLAEIGRGWLSHLDTVALLVGLYATSYNLWAETRERKVANLFELTRSHREIWSRLFEKPELARILNDMVDVAKAPPNVQEELLVQMVILHLRAAFKARKSGMQFTGDAVEADVRQFFRLPIPKSVWARSKFFQDLDFVAFVDGCIGDQP